MEYLLHAAAQWIQETVSVQFPIGMGAGALLGLLLWGLFQLWRRRRLRRSLSLRKGACFAAVPQYTEELLGRRQTMVLWDDALILTELRRLLARSGVRMETLKRDGTRGDILVGGPLSNVYTHQVFAQHLPGVRWMVTREHMNRCTADKGLQCPDYDFFEISESGEEGLQIGEHFFPAEPGKRSWAVLGKFPDGKRTIHLLFGVGKGGTEGAVRCLLHQRAAIWRRHHARPYLGVVEVNAQGERMDKIQWLDTKELWN